MNESFPAGGWSTEGGIIDERRVQRFVTAASAFVIVLGVAATLGWVFGVTVLKSVVPGLTPMKGSTATALVLAGLSLSLQRRPNCTGWHVSCARTLATLVIAIGVVTFGGYELAPAFPFTGALCHPCAGSAALAYWAPMSPNTALSFILVGTALLLLDTTRRGLRCIAELALVATLLIAFIALTGYLMNASALYRTPGGASMAVNTSAGFAVLSAGLLAARPQHGPMALFLQDSAAGRMARFILPLMTAALLSMGWLRLKGQQAGLYGTEFGLALMIAAGTSILVGVVLWNVRTQSRVDRSGGQSVGLMAALRAQGADQFRMALEAAPTGMLMVDGAGKIVLANAQIETLFGYPRAELLGQDLEILVPERFRAHPSGLRAAFFAEPTTRVMGAGGELYGLRKDGTEVPIEIGLNPLRTPDGDFILSSIADITAHKDAQRRLTETEIFLQSVERVSGVGGFMVDLASGAQRWTRQSYRIHDVEDERSSTLRFDELMSPEVRAQLQRPIGQKGSGTGFDIEKSLVTDTGRTIWIRTVGEVERADGVAVRVVGAIQDITAQRAMEQQLREAIRVAERASLAKSEFLANMSHEIRTPLNAMIGLGYLLEQTALNDDQLQFISKIQFAGRSLLCVVNDVLDLSKIEAGEMSLEDEPFDLPELVRDLGQMLSPQAQAKGIDLIVQPSSELPGMVIGDLSRLRQVLINLLNNAIKFTEVGEVELKAFCTDSGADRIHLRCLVNDTGIGIEPAALARLFSPFTQADASTTRRFGGTGLGLSIARRIVEVMGGEIGVTSTKGAGSSFWFEVPLRVMQSGIPIQGAETTEHIRVTIADSDVESAGTMRARLRALGLSAEVVRTREQLLKLVGNPDPEARPEMIVLAPRLQDFDAYQVMRELQQCCAHDDLPPVIVLADSAEVAAQDHRELRRSDCVLLRPVTSAALFNAVNAAVWGLKDGHDRIVQTTNLEGRNAQWLSGVRVLVVDDSDINREVAQRILEGQGAIVSCCSDGAGALEYLRTLRESVDLVLMDVQMPVLDGNEATRQIRAELSLHSLPIVALTAGALSGERQRAIEAGMNDFISKPFDPQVLIRKTRRLVERARNSPLPMVLVSRPISVPSTQQPHLSSIDSSAVRRMFGDDLSLFKALLGRVVQEYADLALPITAPADESMRSVLTARVHKLKGSAGMIGAIRVMKAASAAEKALSTGQPAEVAVATLHQLASALTILREESEELLGSPPKQSVDTADTPERCGLSGADLLELRELLSSHNLAALDKFNSLAEPLLRALGPVRFERLKQAVADLDFPAGVRVLGGAALLKGSLLQA